MNILDYYQLTQMNMEKLSRCTVRAYWKLFSPSLINQYAIAFSVHKYLISTQLAHQYAIASSIQKKEDKSTQKKEDKN